MLRRINEYIIIIYIVIIINGPVHFNAISTELWDLVLIWKYNQ